MKNAENNYMDLLLAARKVADFADNEGASNFSCSQRPCYEHMGAVIADSILQAGLRYATVVRPRVQNILSIYPEAKSVKDVLGIIDAGKTVEFLNWYHPIKVTRFENLVRFMHTANIDVTDCLRIKLQDDKFCISLTKIHGIGFKTVDYMSCLVGNDSIAVDRHIRNFAKRVGVEHSDYHYIKRVFCYAADFLSISRREFDSWVWKREIDIKQSQLCLPV